MKNKHEWFSPSFDLIGKVQFHRICKASLLDIQDTETCTIFHPQILSASTLQDTDILYVNRENRHHSVPLRTTRPTNEAEEYVEVESDTGSLPDRLINPGEYEAVLSTAEEHTTESTENKEQVNKAPSRLTPVFTFGSIKPTEDKKRVNEELRR